MAKKEINKYLIPVEVIKNKPHRWLDITTYEYKLFADSSEKKFTRIKLIDINGFVVGEHMPTKLHTIYDKAAMQVKNNTVKAVSEIRHVVDGVADIAVSAVADMTQDVSKTAKQTAGVAVGLLGKLKSYAQDKIKKTNEEPKITVVSMEPKNDDKNNQDTTSQ